MGSMISTIKLFALFTLQAVLVSINLSNIEFLNWKKLGMPKMKLGTAGWEAQKLPLYYAIPQLIYSLYFIL